MNNILLIDNQEDISSLLSALFVREDDFKIYNEISLEKILELIEKYQFEAIIIDPLLFKENCQKVIQLLLQKDIPLIVHSQNLDQLNPIRDTNIIEFIQKDGINSLHHTHDLVVQLHRNKKMDVLIVEDSIVDQTLLKHILQTYKLNVHTADNGENALEVLNTNQNIKLVITDFIMPVMNGLDLTKEIRKRYKRDQLSIIVISSNDSQNISSMFLNNGANDFIHKGFTKEELYTRVNVNLEIIDLFEKNLQQYEQNLLKDKQITKQESKLQATQELLHNISHHWRQPLSIISTIASSLSIKRSIGQSDPQAEEQAMDAIVDHTQQLSNIIEMFQTIFNPKNISKTIEIEVYIEKYVSMHQARSITTIHNHLDPLKSKVVICTVLLKEVINAILNNAMEATAQNTEPQIDIILENDSKYLLIKFQDNGNGIDENILPNVFDLYFSTKKEKNGTGVGLFIVREIVQNQFNGKVFIQNNASAGITLTISLPIVSQA